MTTTNPPSRLERMNAYLTGELMSGELARALPAGARVEAFQRGVLSAVQKNPDLLTTTQSSFYGACVEAASLGVEVSGVTGEAYLVPLWDRRKGAKLAQLWIGYRGFVKLMRDGEIVELDAGVVRDLDEFEISHGTGAHKFLRHSYDYRLGPTARGDIVGAYCVTKNERGGFDFTYLSREEIDAVFAASPGGSRPDSPWRTHFEAMAAKTAIRRHAKRVNLTPAAARAVELDGQAEAGIAQEFRVKDLGEVEARTETGTDETGAQTCPRDEDLDDVGATPADDIPEDLAAALDAQAAREDALRPPGANAPINPDEIPF